MHTCMCFTYMCITQWSRKHTNSADLSADPPGNKESVDDATYNEGENEKSHYRHQRAVHFHFKFNKAKFEKASEVLEVEINPLHAICVCLVYLFIHTCI